MAAYKLGFAKPEELQAAIKNNETLREIGLGSLAIGGLIKREDWDRARGQSLFQKAARHLAIGNARNPYR